MDGIIVLGLIAAAGLVGVIAAMEYQKLEVESARLDELLRKFKDH